MGKLVYQGTLKNSNDMDDGPVKRAYISWREQRTRCYNKKRQKYKHYGAKGVEVKYNSREFIGWWVEEERKSNYINPTISRIDHNGHYEFDNVFIQERSDNTVERNQRCHSHWREVIIYDFNFKRIDKAISVNDAGRRMGVSPSTVSRQCLNLTKPSCNSKCRYIFRFAS